MSLQLAVGVIFLTVVPATTIIYIRFIYIFLRFKKYRKLECYQLMIQIGIMDCAISPGHIAIGLVHLLGIESLQIADAFLTLFIVVGKMEEFIYVVLALDRLRVICGLQYPKMIHTVIIVLTWAYGLAQIAVLVIPCCEISVRPGFFPPVLDISRPLGFRVFVLTGYIYVGSLFVNFALYVVIVAYISWKKRQGSSSTSSTELNILAYAVLKFLIDLGIFIPSRYLEMSNPTIAFVILLLNTTKLVLVPPVLYLALFKSARAEFFCINQQTVTSVVSLQKATISLQRSSKN